MTAGRAVTVTDPKPAGFATWLQVVAMLAVGMVAIAIAVVLGIWIGMRIGQHHG